MSFQRKPQQPPHGAPQQRVQYSAEEIAAAGFSPDPGLYDNVPGPKDDLDELLDGNHMPPPAGKSSSRTAVAVTPAPAAGADTASSGGAGTVESLSIRLQGLRKDLEKVLPKQIDVDRFIRTTITAVSMNKDLLQADINSLLESTMKAAADGLLCDGREAALVIFSVSEEYQPDPTKSYKQKRWIKKVQYMPMVKGLLKIVYQTGLVSSVSVHEVYEHDTFEYLLGDDEQIIHKPSGVNPRGDIVAAYAIFRLRDGGVQREVMESADLQKVSSVSKAKNGPWAEWEGEMARKSVLRRGIKYLPSTPELDQLLAHDNEMYALDATPNGDRITPANSGEELSRMLTHQPADVMSTTAATAKQKEKVHV